MSETQNEPEQDDVPHLDPTGFGPETIDGQRPPGTEAQTPSADPDPGDPDLETGPNDEPSS
ncbi:hypothetical protein [Aeromicrobium wangtongii]|uniref:hypothetical protein n=1 Tax=Aeromicrobium wangtongii TaxID=2969247 RepID=UPI002017B7A0|nr:hypothetical protein [Aeromicrobium wangtongii]MCL3817181.1 hypothetical protein [Aeromicrobium wangtongii]